MPFVSHSQQKFMFKFHPKMAKEFASKTMDFKSLPEHVKKKAILMASQRMKK